MNKRQKIVGIVSLAILAIINFVIYGLSDMQTIYKGHPSVERVLSDSHDALLNIGYLVLANYLIIVFLFICLWRKGGKRCFIVSVINIVLAGLAIYVLKEYEHRTDIVSSQHPITDFHILEVNRSGGFKGGSSVKIAYNSKEYYTGIPITRCKTEDVEKLAYYYDAKNDAIFEESELNRRYVVFYFILFLCSLLLWLYPEVRKKKP